MSSQSDSEQGLSFGFRVDRVCDSFEDAILEGQAPAIEDVLGEFSDEERPKALRELLKVDVEYRQAKGEEIDADGLLERFARYPEVVAAVLLDVLGPDWNDHFDTLNSNKPALETTTGIENGPGQASLESGKRFDKYTLIREIARGGMGAVYLARDERLGRRVALKVILAGHLASQEATTRFFREMETAAALNHPHIVPLFEAGEVEGNHFFTMGFVDGPNLSEYVKQNDLRPRKIASLLAKCAAAIAYAHGEGIIHRDLKPANILMDPKDEPCITDFGLAKRVDEKGEVTATGQLLGTPSFMSPEQARGKQSEVGQASDVYSIGAVLYWMLTGEAPFRAESVTETLRLISEQDVTRPRKLDKSIPADLETVCLKCLLKKTEDRYANAQELSEDLRRFADGYPVLARRESNLVRWGRNWVRRKSRVVATVASFLAVVLGVWSFTVWHKSSRDLEVAESRSNALEAVQAMDLETPLGLVPIPVPSDNALTAGKVKLGRALFFDRRLSFEGDLACADCHNPKMGWADGLRVASGTHDLPGRRNTPSVINAASNSHFFWDGRADDFEHQALGPLLDPKEMNNPSEEYFVQSIASDEIYLSQFELCFADGLNANNVAKAIAAFERTLLAGNSPYDRFLDGDETAMSISAMRGLELFRGKANCVRCHTGSYLSDHEFHNIGLPIPKEQPDYGREDITGKESDRGKFKTPSLRDVRKTAPYMHDGSLATLRDVVEFYNNGGIEPTNLDAMIEPLGLLKNEIDDLVVFLSEALSSDDYPE